jgi:hypothetical protein
MNTVKGLGMRFIRSSFFYAKAQKMIKSLSFLAPCGLKIREL